MNTQNVANGLGWFSIALGLTEIVAAEPLSRTLGIKSPHLLRAFGLREIAAGVGILTQDRKAPGIWARVVGDALDVAVLGAAMTGKKGGNAAIAAAAVAPVVALDVFCAAKMSASA